MAFSLIFSSIKLPGRIGSSLTSDAINPVTAPAPASPASTPNKMSQSTVKPAILPAVLSLRRCAPDWRGVVLSYPLESLLNKQNYYSTFTQRLTSFGRVCYKERNSHRRARFKAIMRNDKIAITMNSRLIIREDIRIEDGRESYANPRAASEVNGSWRSSDAALRILYQTRNWYSKLRSR